MNDLQIEDFKNDEMRFLIASDGSGSKRLYGGWAASQGTKFYVNTRKEGSRHDTIEEAVEAYNKL